MYIYSMYSIVLDLLSSVLVIYFVSKGGKTRSAVYKKNNGYHLRSMRILLSLQRDRGRMKEERETERERERGGGGEKDVRTYVCACYLFVLI